MEAAEIFPICRYCEEVERIIQYKRVDGVVQPEGLFFFFFFKSLLAIRAKFAK